MITEIDNRERDLSLENREGEERAVRKRPEAPELRALREEAAVLRREREEAAGRLAAARKVKPQGSELHCSRCFNSGRDAALGVMEGTRKA